MLLGLPRVRMRPIISGWFCLAAGLFLTFYLWAFGSLGGGPILMEIVLALIVGLAVAGVVFALGRFLFASKNSCDLVSPQPEPSISNSAAPSAANEEVRTVNEFEKAANLTAPLSERQGMKRSKSARRTPAAQPQDPATALPRPRRRKTTVPGPDVVQ
jgi:hypothetical protein